MKISPLKSCLVASIATVSFSGFSSAATLSGSLDAGSPFIAETSFNLTSLGASDWAYWNTADSPASVAATNSKSGASLISDMFAIGGGSLRGTGSETQPAASFSFSDGTSPVSGSVTEASGLFNTQLGTENVGLGFTIDLPTTDTYTIYIWAAAFDIDAATLSVSLSGATDYSYTTIIDGAGADGVKDTYLFTIVASADTAGDDLTVNLVNVDDGESGTAGQVILTGAAVSVPEPTTSALILSSFGFLCALIVRRRR